MKTSTSKPSITRKFPIEVPTHTYGSPLAVYKVWFGKAYFIWKGLSLLQSANNLAEGIERYIRLDKNDPADIMHNLCKYIKKHKVKSATIEVIETDFPKKRTITGIDCLAMLNCEQAALDEAKGDPLCLNTNTEAYVSAWMEKGHIIDVKKFRASRVKK